VPHDVPGVAWKRGTETMKHPTAATYGYILDPVSITVAGHGTATLQR
jgi:hypothetical protein